ncbi:hypothetical protein BJV78DRAFT_1193688 [Lactifluus subvellereus]|nr:hypothetical protein BJV78DRAFT_1193688 [Lactifluus subvellereus]
MPVTVCPVAAKGRKCWDVQCHLRHDIVRCGPCRCFVLHESLARHRRGEEHRRNCRFPEKRVHMKLLLQTILSPGPPYPRVPKPTPRTPALNRARKNPTGGSSARCGDRRYFVVSRENGLTFKSTSDISTVQGKGNTVRTSTIAVVIQKVERNRSLALVDVGLTGAGSKWFSVKVQGTFPVQIRWRKPREVQVSFLPAVPGEWNAALVLHFFERTQGQNVVITRRLHGIATFPKEKPRHEQLSGTKGGGRTRHSRPGSNKPTKQHAITVQVINLYHFPFIPVPG